MKLGTHVYYELLNQTISIFLAQPTKKASYEDFQRKPKKCVNFWTPWDISLIFCVRYYYIHSLFSKKFFWNWMMWTGLTSFPKYWWGWSIILPSSPTNPNANLYKKISNFYNFVIFNQGTMKLGTHVLYELLNPTISIFFGPTNQKSVL